MSIFTETAAWNEGRKSARSNGEVKKLLSFRNDKTHADEALIIIRAVVFVATAFTFYCGYLYYSDTFSRTFSPSMGWAAAIALALLVEVAKVFLTHLALRSIVFKWMFEDWFALGFWLVVAGLGVGAYCWSFSISTEGMKALTGQQAEERTERDTLTALIAAATARIDGQIEAAQGTTKTALDKKTKAGKATYRGLAVAEQSSKTIASLQAQRQTVVDQVTADYKKADGKRETKITGWAAWVKRFGGYMEWITLLGLVAIVFAEVRLVNANLQTIQEQEAKAAAGGATNDDFRSARP